MAQTWTVYGTPRQTYYVTSGTNYTADISGKIANVADTDLADLVRQGLVVQRQVQRVAPAIRTFTGTTDTITAADGGGAVRYTNGSAVTVTVPAGLGAGFSTLILQRGAGKVSVQSDGTTVITNRQSQTGTGGNGAACSLFADAADQFIWAGDTG
jgi:hypothetical protein